MSIQPPQGILNIPNATLRVGKLAVDSTAGFDTVFNNVERNTILLVDSTEYTETKQWDLKMPNIFVATFEIKGGGSSFNFRNTSNGVATTGYTLTFSGTTLTLKYGEILSEEVVVHELTTATIPDLDLIYGKVYLTYEKQHFTVTVDGTLVLTYKDTTTRTPPDGEYVNFFAGTGSPGFKNLKVVAGHFISDGTSNIAYVGGGEVAVGKALAFNRVSNVSQIKVDSSVVAEYTGPHDRPLRKYPEVALTADAETGSGYKGYKVTASNDIDNNSNLDKFRAFNGITGNEAWGSGGSQFTSGTGVAIVGGDSLGNVEGQWLKLQLPLKIKLSHIKLTSRDITGIEYPKDFQILGSNDDSNWTQLINVVDAPYTQHLTLTHHVTGTVDSFQYLAVVVTKTYGGTGVTISELEYYGHEEGSGSLDTTLKSVYNVPATTGTQLEVYYDAKDLADGALSTASGAITGLGGTTINGTAFGDPQVSNGAFVFDGTGDYISGTLPSSVTGEWVHSMSIWVKAYSFGNSIIFIGNSNVNSQRISISISSTGEITIGIANHNVIYASAIPIDYGWHHLTYTYAGGAAGLGAIGYNLYIDGVNIPQTGGVGSGTLNLPTGPNFFVGSGLNGVGPFNGSIANFRLYSKALNADQVKELYDYQKDYFLGTHSSVTLHKGRFGVGTKEPMKELDVVGDVGISANLHMTTQSSVLVDSNVVAEYTGPHDRPLRKYPEVAILGGQSGLSGGYTQDGYTVEASSEFSAIHAASNVFNHIQAYQTTDHAWLSGTNTYGLTDGLASSGTSKDTFQDVDGSWLGITLPTGIRLSHIHIYNRFDNANSVRPPKTGIIWASNDGTSWYNIFNFDNLQDTDGTLNVLHVNNTNFYTRYRVQITAMHNDPQKTSVAVGELEFYGHEEGSGSLDTTLKSVYNVPATTGTQLEVYYDAKDLDNGAVTSVTDLSPNTNNGTLSGDPQISNGAFVFDGSGDAIVSSGTSTSLDGNATFSISLWSKTNTVSSGSNALFMLGYSSANKSTGLRIDASTGKYRFFTTGGLSSKTSPTTALLNEWTHITLIHEGTSGYKFYVNGVFIDEITVDNDLSLDSNPRVALGNYIDAAGVVTGTASYDGSIANFRLYSKALNAGQVQELYDYQKDYFLGSKSQVTLYKGHLGVGVTEPSGQLELAGDERIQEYPPRGLVGDNLVFDPAGNAYDYNVEGHGVFKLLSTYKYHTSTSDDRRIYKLFDKSDSTFTHWSSFNGSSPYEATTNAQITTLDGGGTITAHFAEIQMPYKITLKKYILTSSSQVPRALKTGMIVGSNDGNVFHVLDSVSDFGFTATTQPKEYTVDNTTTPYRIFRLLLMNTNGNATCNMNEWKLFGTPGPTTLDKGSLSLTRSLDVPRVSRYDVDTETPRPEKLVLDLDTTVNSSPTDISGKGNHGVFYNGASYSAADKAFNFDGTNDYIQATTNLPAGDNSLSISMWIKIRSRHATHRDTLFFLGGTGSNKGIGIDVYPDGNVYWYDRAGYHLLWNTSATAPANVGTNELFPLNQWVHVAATHVPGSNAGYELRNKFYINGVKLADPASGTAYVSDGVGTLSIDANPTVSLGLYPTPDLNSCPDALISNFKLYNVALEPSEVKKLYNLGRTGRSMVISDTAVGIGKVPEAQLDVRGTARFADVHVGGDIYATGNITGYSDKRAKSDIEKIENALEKIEQLNGYTFTMKGKRYTGLIAQEILPVLPEAVTGSEETNYAVAYGNMMGLIVEAIKELKQKIG
jgi:hypothetical protein